MLPPYQPCVGFVPAYTSYFEGLDAELGNKKRSFADRILNELQIASRNSACQDVRWIPAPLVCTTEAAARAATDLIAQGADVLIVAPMIAVFGELLLAACAEKVPVLVLSVSPEEDIPIDYTMAHMVTQSSGLGTQALCNTLVRRGRCFEVCCGSIEDAALFQRAVDAVSAMALPSKLRGSRMGAIGSRFASMTDVDLDTGSLQRDTGIETVEISTEEWTAAYRDVDAGAARDVIRHCRDRFQVQDIEDDELERSARLAVSLETLVERHGLDFGAINSHGENCLRNPEIGVMATLGVSLLSSRGVPLAEVGDLPTAIAMIIVKLLAGAAVYAELDAVGFRDSQWFIANSGELDFNAASCDSPVILRGSENFRGLHGRGASFDAVVRPGPATLTSFTPVGNAARPYRLIAAQGKILQDRRQGFHAVHALLEVGNAGAKLESWCRAGAVHHAALAPGHLVKSLSTLCRAWPAVDLIEVAA